VPALCSKDTGSAKECVNKSTKKHRCVNRETKFARDDDEKQHSANCCDAKCLRCKFIRNRRAWELRLPFLRDDMGIDISAVPPVKQSVVQGSWLQCIVDGDAFSVGCVVCSQTWGDVQICNLSNHQATARHIAAVRTFCGCELGPSGKPTSGAPTEDEFRQAWDLISNGNAPEQGVKDVGQAEKIRRMLFCLFEGLSILDRQHLAGATIGLSRDERHFKLLIRYSAVNKDLEVRKGVLWQVAKCPGASDKITELTVGALVKFSTSMYGAPDTAHARKVPVGITDFGLVKHIVAATEVMKVDSASNEICSCQTMQHKHVDIDGEKVRFKHMLIARDKAHGSRRT
jgi:ubiquitin